MGKILLSVAAGRSAAAVLFSLFLINALRSPLGAAVVDPVAKDEAALGAHFKALHDAKSEVREAAAGALRRIVAKYPSRTSNIRSKDGAEAFWTEKVNQVKPGMTKAEV